MADWLPKLYYSENEIALLRLQLEIAWSGFATDLQNYPNTFTADELDQFEMLDTGYAEWKKSLGWWERNSGATVDVIKGYAKQLKYWIDLFNQRTGNKLTGAGVSQILTPDDTSPLFSANFSAGELISKESTDKLQTIVVAICVAVGLTAIARTVRG
jgi:hypothetical protein